MASPGVSASASAPSPVSGARRLGYAGIVLETGDRQPEALGLYASAGYERIPCYGIYATRTLSMCFEKTLVPGTS